MDDYQLAPEAEEDLEEIFRYTIDKWGFEQARRYKSKLAAHFARINEGKARTRAFLARNSALRVSRCEHHYVFHLDRKGDSPLIVAVLHEHRDLVNRIKERLAL